MKSLIVAVMVVAMTASLVAEGQGDLPVCAANLLACANDLNTTTTPPPTCCIPLKEAVTDQLPCLCKLYNDTRFLISFGLNVTQATELPARCGVNFSISECTGSPAPTTTPNSPMPRSGSSTPNSQIAPSAPPPSTAGRSATATYSCLFILAAAMLYWA